MIRKVIKKESRTKEAGTDQKKHTKKRAQTLLEGEKPWKFIVKHCIPWKSQFSTKATKQDPKSHQNNRKRRARRSKSPPKRHQEVIRKSTSEENPEKASFVGPLGGGAWGHGRPRATPRAHVPPCAAELPPSAPGPGFQFIWGLGRARTSRVKAEVFLTFAISSDICAHMCKCPAIWSPK